MSDAATPPPNDLENQLEALMQQARTEDATPQDKANLGNTEQAAVAVKPKPTPDDADPSLDLAAQLDALIAKAEAQASTDETAGDTPADASASDAHPIADGPDDVEDAFDDLQGAFDAVQDVIAELEPPPAPQPPTASESADTTESAAAASPKTPFAQAESEQSDEDLVAQLQSLLDAASDEEAQNMVSPAEVLNDNAAVGDTDTADDDDELDGDFDAPPTQAVTPDKAPVAEAASQATQPPTEESEPSPQSPPLIDQIDTLLADHAEDAISGEFESVDELLGVNETSGQYMADPTQDSADDDDGLDCDFQPIDEVLTETNEKEPAAEEPPAKPSPAPAPTSARREEPAKELDELDGLFAAPAASTAEPAIEADTPESQDDDADAEGGFESLDAMLAAPPPSEEDRDGAPPTPESKTQDNAKANTDSAAGWEITLNLKTLRAAALFASGWMLWTCAILNKPLDKLPGDIKQTVGWVALAVAGPGLLLIAYGLLLN